MTQLGLLQQGQAEGPRGGRDPQRAVRGGRPRLPRGRHAGAARAAPGLRCGRRRSRRGDAGRCGHGRAPVPRVQPLSAPSAAAPAVPSCWAPMARAPEHPRAHRERPGIHTRARAHTRGPRARAHAHAHPPPGALPWAPSPEAPLPQRLGSGRVCGEGNSLLTGCGDPPGRGATPEAATAADPPRPPPPRSRAAAAAGNQWPGRPVVTSRRAGRGRQHHVTAVSFVCVVAAGALLRVVVGGSLGVRCRAGEAAGELPAVAHVLGRACAV